MDNGVITTSDLLRLIGFMGVCVGLAWALQVLGFRQRQRRLSQADVDPGRGSDCRGRCRGDLYVAAAWRRRGARLSA